MKNDNLTQLGLRVGGIDTKKVWVVKRRKVGKASSSVKLIIILVAAVAALCIPYFGMKWHYLNKDQKLRNLAAAQEDVCRLVYDETWKIIKQQAQVADRHVEAYRKIFPELMEGRYGNARGGALLSFIQESNPNYDSSLFIKLATSIEAQRHKYTNTQKMLRDIKRDHDDIRTIVPGKWFVGHVEELKVTLVTSTRTQEVYKTGTDDNVEMRFIVFSCFFKPDTVSCEEILWMFKDIEVMLLALMLRKTKEFGE